MNDGIIATAGVIEGFLAAGAGTNALLAASITATATVAGAGSLGGVKFTETATERGMANAHAVAALPMPPWSKSAWFKAH